MSSSSISASETRRPHLGRYLILLGLWVAGLVAAFLALVALTYGVRSDAPPSAVAERLLAKMNHAASLEGPRTLVFAGSQAFYNVSAERLERAIGRPAVNLGTHGSQSLPLLTWEVRNVARRGDLVILPLEYSFYGGGGLTTYGVAIAHAAGLPLFPALTPGEKIRYLRELHLEDLLEGLAVRLGLAGGVDAERLSLDVTPRGDVIHPPQDRRLLLQAIRRASRPSAALSDEARKELSSLLAWAESEGVTVLFAPPGMIDAAVPREADRTRLASDLATLGARYLELADGGAVPAEAMLDTTYHAAREGAALYTAAMVVALCDKEVAKLTCDPAEVAEASETLSALDEHGMVFGEDPRIAGRGQRPVRLAEGEKLTFSVAAFRGCRNELDIRGSGLLSAQVTGAGQQQIRLEQGMAKLVLPPRQTLLDVELQAGSRGATVSSLRRVSDCAVEAEPEQTRP